MHFLCIFFYSPCWVQLHRHEISIRREASCQYTIGMKNVETGQPALSWQIQIQLMKMATLAVTHDVVTFGLCVFWTNGQQYLMVNGTVMILILIQFTLSPFPPALTHRGMLRDIFSIWYRGICFFLNLVFINLTAQKRYSAIFFHLKNTLFVTFQLLSVY